MYTFRLWLGSAIFALGIASWVWFFRNMARPRMARAMILKTTNIFIIIISNIILVIVGFWIYPLPETIPVVALIIGLILGWRISRTRMKFN